MSTSLTEMMAGGNQKSEEVEADAVDVGEDVLRKDDTC